MGQGTGIAAPAPCHCDTRLSSWPSWVPLLQAYSLGQVRSHNVVRATCTCNPPGQRQHAVAPALVTANSTSCASCPPPCPSGAATPPMPQVKHTRPHPTTAPSSKEVTRFPPPIPSPLRQRPPQSRKSISAYALAPPFTHHHSHHHSPLADMIPRPCCPRFAHHVSSAAYFITCPPAS